MIKVIFFQEQYVFDANTNYLVVDYARAYTDRIAQKRVIAFANNQDSQNIIVFNSLTTNVRHDIITLVVASENLKVSAIKLIYLL